MSSTVWTSKLESEELWPAYGHFNHPKRLSRKREILEAIPQPCTETYNLITSQVCVQTVCQIAKANVFKTEHRCSDDLSEQVEQ